MATYVPVVNLPTQFFDNNGDPLESGSLEFYLAGTTTTTDPQENGNCVDYSNGDTDDDYECSNGGTLLDSKIDLTSMINDVLSHVTNGSRPISFSAGCVTA